jgi:Family of unknown function (DUF6152)
MNRNRRDLIRAIGVLAVSAVLPADAHHSFSAMYDAKKPIRLSGKLRTIHWTNPHAWLELEVAGKDGELSLWRCEGAAPGILSSRGLAKTDVKPGDRLVIDGYLARSGARVIDARRIKLPDGRLIDGGSSGDGGPTSAAAKTQKS